MATFQDRLLAAHARESKRRADAGLPKLTKTAVWKAAGATSAAATFWYNGANGADLDTCIRIAPVLRCNPYWLFDGREPMDGLASHPPGAAKDDGAQDVAEKRRSLLKDITHDELTVIEGFRVADAQMRATILGAALVSLHAWGKRKDELKNA